MKLTDENLAFLVSPESFNCEIPILRGDGTIDFDNPCRFKQEGHNMSEDQLVVAKNYDFFF